MKVIFLDAAFYIALLNTRDRLHQVSVSRWRDYRDDRGVSFVTTETVLVEVLTRLSRSGPDIRARAGDLIARLRDDHRLTIVPQSTELFSSGLDLYRRRLDKTYSMPDCISMVVCRERRITEVLTADHDFEQEGFTILLTA